MIIDRSLLHAFRKDLTTLRRAKVKLEYELFKLRAEIGEYEETINWIERSIRSTNDANLRSKNKSRCTK